MEPFLNFGILEVIISCLAGLLVIGLPIAVLVFLWVIYKKLQGIEETLKKE